MQALTGCTNAELSLSDTISCVDCINTTAMNLYKLFKIV
jgi:hypothetical protein